MITAIQAYAAAKVVFELATYRWKGPRQHLGVAWAITFADPQAAIVQPTMPAPDRRARLGGKEVDFFIHEDGPRVVVHHPDGVSEIRALDVVSLRNTMGRGFDAILAQLSGFLGIDLDAA